MSVVGPQDRVDSACVQDVEHRFHINKGHLVLRLVAQSVALK